jgi:hypothetical protein
MTTTLTPPTQQAVASIWSEMQRLNVPMRGWWYEPLMPTPSFGMEVDKEALTDWEVDWMIFEWDEENGWTMDSHCAPGMTDVKPVVMDVADPYDVPAVARHFKAVIDGQIDEFRHVA